MLKNTYLRRTCSQPNNMKSFDYVTRTLHVILKQTIPVQFLQNQNVILLYIKFITNPESSLKEGRGAV